MYKKNLEETIKLKGEIEKFKFEVKGEIEKAEFRRRLIRNVFIIALTIASFFGFSEFKKIVSRVNFLNATLKRVEERVQEFSKYEKIIPNAIEQIIKYIPENEIVVSSRYWREVEGYSMPEDEGLISLEHPRNNDTISAKEFSIVISVSERLEISKISEFSVNISYKGKDGRVYILFSKLYKPKLGFNKFYVDRIPPKGPINLDIMYFYDSEKGKKIVKTYGIRALFIVK